MAISNAGQASLTFTNLPIGVQVTKITDTSADWASVANSTYFYDKGDGLVHYKNSGGTVLELFSAGGLTNFTEATNSSAPNATVPVNSLTATGAATNIDAAIRPKGTGAFALAVADNTPTGGNKRGVGAVDLQLTRAASSRVASGNYSVTIGRENTASNTDSIVIGSGGNASNTNAIVIGTGTASGANSAVFGVGTATNLQAVSVGYQSNVSGQEAVAFGHYNTSSNSYSLALGRNNISSGFGSTAIGFNSNSYGRYGAMTWAGGSSTAQVTQMIYRGNTIDNSLVSLNAQEYFDDATNTFSLQNQSAYRFKGTVIAKQAGSTNVAAWDIDGLIVRGANAASTTLNISNVNVVQNTPGWGTPVLSASTSFGSLRVQVQGAVATTIRWCVLIEGTEVIYA